MATRSSGKSVKDEYKHQLLQHARRFRLIWLGVLAFFLIFTVKLIDIQVVNAKFYQEKAKKARSQSTVVFNRGRILDRNGVVLAQDTVLYDVYAHPRYYYKATPLEIAEQLAPILNKPVSELEQKLKLPYETISIQKNIPKPLAKQIQRLALSGIETPKKMVRRYPQGNLASHIIGYINEDASISTGIEKTAEKVLRTLPEKLSIELAGNGDFMNVQHLKPELITDLPKANDVQLTIDSRIQYAAEAALAKGLEINKAKRGAAIVMEPKTGDIMAFAVLPDFDPERYYKAQPESLKNWAITDVYPPGSTFKILTVASGLESGVINRNSHLHDTGYLRMNGFTIKNYDYSQHGAPGDIDLVYLFQHSSNIGSLLISLMMDPAEHHRLLKSFGMGQKTHIDIPGESSGILHPPKAWDQLTHATIGFGYGLASTPMQMAAAIAAIANDGVWVTPHLLRDETNIIRRRSISVETARTVTELLAESIDVATASTVRIEGFRVAGKTGTSRKPVENGKGYSNEVFTSFVGYFPAEDPQALVMVVVDSPGVGNAWGSTVAGPIFRDIATQTAGYLGLKPTTTLASQNTSKKPL